VELRIRSGNDEVVLPDKRYDVGIVSESATVVNNNLTIRIKPRQRGGSRSQRLRGKRSHCR
jgi:hypothetical protein